MGTSAIPARKTRKSVPLEIILRSKPPALVGYKQGGICIAHVVAREGESGYDLLDETDGLIAPETIAWVDSSLNVRIVLRDYPLSEHLIYDRLYRSIICYRNRAVGYIGGTKKSEKKAASSRLNGANFGGRPPNSR